LEGEARGGYGTVLRVGARESWEKERAESIAHVHGGMRGDETGG